MSDDSSAQERTEEATGKRLEEAREKGQVVRSRELNTALILFSAVMLLLSLFSSFFQSISHIYESSLALRPDDLLDDKLLPVRLHEAGYEMLRMFFPFAVVMLMVGFLSPILIGGWNFSIGAVMPQWNRMSFSAGLKRMFSAQAIVELLKALSKFLLISVVAVLFIKIHMMDILGREGAAIDGAIAAGLKLCALALLIMTLAMMAIALIDVPWQIFNYRKGLRMTRQEIRDEFKETEGKPEVRSKIRQLQRQMAERRMMSDVPTADVVITNPTHFAVALKYDKSSMNAPLVVAKGADLVAARIREVAKEHAVPLVEAPPLARALYFSTDIDREIPAGLYVAVAQLLAYVWRLRRFHGGLGKNPGPTPAFTVPEEFRKD